MHDFFERAGIVAERAIRYERINLMRLEVITADRTIPFASEGLHIGTANEQNKDSMQKRIVEYWISLNI
jgi:hypothetical protein